MNWNLLPACFFVGLVVSVIGVLGECCSLHLPASFHMPDQCTSGTGIRTFILVADMGRPAPAIVR